MTFDAGAFVTAGIAVIGGLIWFVRLEGRVNTTEQRFGDLKNDVQYIRERIDKALNGRD